MNYIDYFINKTCRYCLCNFAPDAVNVLREESHSIVVRVICTTCQTPLGVAIISIDRVKSKSNAKDYPKDWTVKDKKRLRDLPAITAEDCLAFHEYLKTCPTATSEDR